jgi:putative chitinase
MQIPKFFSLKEMTATSQKLPNSPETWEEFSNLRDTAVFLDRLRERFGQGIRINSGYRSAAVNAAVGGSKTSAHRKGMAADIQPWKNTKANMLALAKLCREWATTLSSPVDQVIIYTPDGKDNENIKWIHIGFSDKPRHQLFFKKG